MTSEYSGITNGTLYGEWTVCCPNFCIKYNTPHSLCRCSCGKLKTVSNRNLLLGKTFSCGHNNGENNKTHGESKTRLHEIWLNIRKRCLCKTNTNYYLYGERGITICEEWNDYLKFKEWALSHGYSEIFTLDRINNNGNYEPSNCRWATDEQQHNNTRRNIFVASNGKTQTLRQWSREVETAYTTMRYRKHHGWKDEEVLYGRS